MAETIAPALEYQPDEYTVPTTLDELATMASIDSMQTLVDVLGTPADSLSQPRDLKRAMMETTETVGTNDSDGEQDHKHHIVYDV